MFLIRRTEPRDLDILFKLSKTVHFINLPADKDIIEAKIRRSMQCFEAVAEGAEIESAPGDNSAAGGSPLFMFTLEDSETGNCLGTSMVVSGMGTAGHPNLSFKLEQRHFFSQDLQQGTTHMVATLFSDESSPSEIGGLILGPSFRGHPHKLGKQLSLIRFHFMGLHRERFSDRILAEMMAPVTADGENAFWNHLGRKFINLPYHQADVFCQFSREFMTSLLPKEPLYLTLLPPEARRMVGQVGKDTIPARKMLEGLGFKYTGRIDPFDGGPHLEAKTEEITLVKQTGRAKWAGVCDMAEAKDSGFVSLMHEGGDFRAVYAPVRLNGEALSMPAEWASMIEANDGQRLGFTPIDLKIGAKARPKTTKKKTTKKPTAA